MVTAKESDRSVLIVVPTLDAYRSAVGLKGGPQRKAAETIINVDTCERDPIVESAPLRHVEVIEVHERPIWQDPSWIAEIDDTTMGEQD